MPIKLRAAKQRRPTFSAETLALFVKLERMPQRGQAFKDGEHELMRQLGLTDAWWSGNSVLDRSRGPCHPPGYIAHANWHRCRAVREMLLAVSA